MDVCGEARSPVGARVVFVRVRAEEREWKRGGTGGGQWWDEERREGRDKERAE